MEFDRGLFGQFDRGIRPGGAGGQQGIQSGDLQNAANHGEGHPSHLQHNLPPEGESADRGQPRSRCGIHNVHRSTIRTGERRGEADDAGSEIRKDRSTAQVGVVE